LCNVDRLITVLADRGLDGVVALTATNQFYLSSFGRHHSIPEENGLFPVIFSRHHPDHPVLVMPDFDLARLSFQPTWIRDVRPFQSVLPPGVQPSWNELSRFVPDQAFRDAGASLGNGVYYPEMVTAIHAAMRDLGLDRGVVGFDNLAVGQAIASAFPRCVATARYAIPEQRSRSTSHRVMSPDRLGRASPAIEPQCVPEPRPRGPTPDNSGRSRPTLIQHKPRSEGI